MTVPVRLELRGLDLLTPATVPGLAFLELRGVVLGNQQTALELLVAQRQGLRVVEIRLAEEWESTEG